MTTAEVFEQSKIVCRNDLDEQQHVNNVRYVAWIQEIAKAHWLSRVNDSIKDSYFWVVIRHEIDYKNQALLGDELLLRTFVGEQTHVTSVRYLNILNKATGVSIVNAKSTWCLMDAKTKKPVKIPEEIRHIFS